jgi:hypothetical protein
MQAMNAFGEDGSRLEWTAGDPAAQVDFLDLTITIDPHGHITTCTFQKKMNRYLYIPPTSAHSPSILYGLIFGTMHRYFWQNSDPLRFKHFADCFFRHLLQRGHSWDSLAPLFASAAEQVDRSTMPIPQVAGLPNERNNNNDVFLHLPYHPQDVGRHEPQQIFKSTCADAFSSARTPLGNPAGLDRMVIAYSRAPNISNLVRRNRLGPAVNTHVSGSAC